MKALILVFVQSDRSGFKLLRAYTTNERKLADLDLNMMRNTDTFGNYELIECDFVSDL